MLTKAQEKLIRSLATKKGRQASGRCLAEGAKVVEAAGSAVEFTFTSADSPEFARLVTTETPQDVAAVARVPQWTMHDVAERSTVVVLDGVQDPGNVGAVLRLCLGFRASLLLVRSADPTSPKVVRSSAGAMFGVPWVRLDDKNAVAEITGLHRPVFRLEKRDGAGDVKALAAPGEAVLVAGSEASGISLPLEGRSVAVPHDPALESLNVGNAVAIALYARSRTDNA